MVRGLYKYVIFVASLLSSLAAFSAQTEKLEVVALKNNLLYDAALTPNLELEIRLAPKWSMEVGAGFNPFPLDDTKFPKWRHVSAWIAPRYWFCNVFHRGFISFNVAPPVLSSMGLFLLATCLMNGIFVKS